MAHADQKPKTAKGAPRAATGSERVPTKAKGVLKVARERRWDLVEEALRNNVPLSEREGDKLIKLALDEEDWMSITMGIFRHCVGLWGPHAKAAMRRAVEQRNWQFFVQAEDCMHMVGGEPEALLDILKIRPVLFDRMERNCAIHDVLDDAKWQQAVFEIVLDALSTWCQLSRSSRKWDVLLETMVDFQDKTDNVEKYLEDTILVLEDKDVDDVHHLCQAALEHRMYFIVKYMATYQYLTKSQAGQAAWMALGERDWYTFVYCIYAGANVYQFYHDSSALHIALRQDFFQLEKILPLDPDLMDLEDCTGMTFLHTALNCWRENHSETVANNIKLLLENQADISLNDPEGVTVLQKLSDKSQDQDPLGSKHRSELIVAAVEAAVRLKKEINWAPASVGGWNALHCLCAEGHFEGLPRLLELGADPFQQRRGLTLIDTTLLADGAAPDTKMKVLQALLQVPLLVEDHVYVVQNRPFSQDADYTFPLLRLLRLTMADEGNFQLIKVLNVRKAFVLAEQREAMQEVILGGLRKQGLQHVVDYLVMEIAEQRLLPLFHCMKLKTE